MCVWTIISMILWSKEMQSSSHSVYLVLQLASFPPQVFAYSMRSKTGGGNGLGMRLMFAYCKWSKTGPKEDLGMRLSQFSLFPSCQNQEKRYTSSKILIFGHLPKLYQHSVFITDIFPCRYLPTLWEEPYFLLSCPKDYLSILRSQKNTEDQRRSDTVTCAMH